jgi:hypothetical protein
VREADRRAQRQKARAKVDVITAVKRRFDKPDGRSHYQTWLRKGVDLATGRIDFGDRTYRN